MYSRILVPVDGSDTALAGLKESVRLAKNQGGKLCLLHIVDELVLDYTAGSGLYADTVIDTLREGGKKILADAQALARDGGVEAESVLVETIGGPAAALIVEQAKYGVRISSSWGPTAAAACADWPSAVMRRM